MSTTSDEERAKALAENLGGVLLLAALPLMVMACGPPQSVVDARTKLKAECSKTPTCRPGNGTCVHDPEADATVCLCDDGCYYAGED